MGHCILINLSFHLELAGLQVFFDKLGSFCVAWSSLGKAQFLRRVLGFWGGFKAMGIPSGLEEDWGLGKNFGHRKGLGCG